MEVKKGYKQTEDGVIPKVWETKPLKRLSSFITKGATPTTYGYSWEIYGVLFLRSECVSENGLDLSKSMFISPEAHSALIRGEVHSGDILMTITGNVGRVVFLENNFGIANTNQHIARIRIIDPSTDAEYIYHFLSQPSVRKYYNSITTGQAYPQTSLPQVRDTKIYLPPFPEQRAIATALSDVDALLTTLDSLIAKKRLVKQGVMQELLTGKRRLSGFSGNWETRTLTDVCNFINDGTHFTPKYVDDGIPFYSVENVTANDFTNTKFISHQEHSRLIKRCKPEKGDILMTRIGSLGDTKLIDWDVNASIYVSLALLKVNRQAIDEKYLYCYTKSRKFIQDVETRSLVNAIPQKINMAEIGGVPVLVPTVPEQQAIAEILSDMDTEISALETRREKTRLLKQGMMQELLTGKIRLV